MQKLKTFVPKELTFFNISENVCFGTIFTVARFQYKTVRLKYLAVPVGTSSVNYNLVDYN